MAEVYRREFLIKDEGLLFVMSYMDFSHSKLNRIYMAGEELQAVEHVLADSSCANLVMHDKQLGDNRMPISCAQFAEIAKHYGGYTLSKDVYDIQLDLAREKHVIGMFLNRYFLKGKPFFKLVVTFVNKEHGNAWKTPEWASEEITGNPDYTEFALLRGSQV